MEEAQKLMHFYKVFELPTILIIDPVTGGGLPNACAVPPHICFVPASSCPAQPVASAHAPRPAQPCAGGSGKSHSAVARLPAICTIAEAAARPPFVSRTAALCCGRNLGDASLCAGAPMRQWTGYVDAERCATTA